ncbi:uncharacterized protein LOC141658905 [Silene latifolia]|uniref:uncharacterized protein LOC141658905 n=1 Tax=Silene latifolia TaxID=37657 RepID=UPI003D77E7E1
MENKASSSSKNKEISKDGGSSKANNNRPERVSNSTTQESRYGHRVPLSDFTNVTREATDSNHGEKRTYRTTLTTRPIVSATPSTENDYNLPPPLRSKMARFNRKELHGDKRLRSASSGTPITPSLCTTPGSSRSRQSCLIEKEPDPVTRLVNELISDLNPTNGGSSSCVDPQQGASSHPSSSRQQALDHVARLVSDLVRNLSEEYDDSSSRGANEEGLIFKITNYLLLLLYLSFKNDMYRPF